MFEKKEKSKSKVIQATFLGFIVLVICLITISIVKRNRTVVSPNEAGNAAEFLTDTIFDDIKIKINSDMFSLDALKQDNYNNAVAEYLKKNLSKGDTVIHVSHGIGIQTLLMAKLVDQSGRVYVYNPCEKYVDAIKSSAEENNFTSRIQISAMGMSDHNFNGMLLYKNNFPIMSGKIETADYKIPDGYSAMPVKVSSIDDQLPNLQNINLLRISIGGENCSDIINGAMSIIRKSPKISIICDYDSSKFNDLAIFEELSHLGFELYTIQPDGGLEKQSQINELSSQTNCYLLLKREEKSEEMPTKTST